VQDSSELIGPAEPFSDFLADSLLDSSSEGKFFIKLASLKQGFSNISVPVTPFRGKKFPRIPLIFITVIEHKVNV